MDDMKQSVERRWPPVSPDETDNTPEFKSRKGAVAAGSVRLMGALKRRGY